MAANEPLAALYERERGALVGRAARITGEHAAEDLVHEAFMAYLVRPPDADRPGAWLNRVVRNRALNALRRPRSAQVPESAPTDPDEEPSAVANRSVLREIIGDALNALPSRSRRALVLRFYEQHDYPDIACALGVSTPQAHVIVHRATKRLGRELVRRMAVSHDAESCRPALERMARLGGALGDHPAHPCSRCSPVWEELLALRGFPALVGTSRSLRAIGDRVLADMPARAEPLAHAAAVATIALASLVAQPTVPSADARPGAPTAPEIREPEPPPQSRTVVVERPAVDGAVRPDHSSVPRREPADVPDEPREGVDVGGVHVTDDDDHAQTEVQEGAPGWSGVVVCKAPDPCPPPPS